jgi:hypothetical protein
MLGDVNSSLHSGPNACYCSVLDLLSSQTEIYWIIILPFLSCGIEARSLPLREENRLIVFESRILRGVFGCKRVQVADHRKLHSEELHNLYSPPTFNPLKMKRICFI